MEYIKLNNSELKVSRLCMGGCPLGEYGWGDVRRSDLFNAIYEALDNGITMFDTADTYGLGKSEENLGKALKCHRNEVVIATKFGVRVGNGETRYDNSKDWIIEACHSSLKRLDTDYIDLYQIHYRDGKTPILDVVDTLERLQKEGLIRYFGLSNIHDDDYIELQNVKGKFVSFQDEYSLACRKNENDIINISNNLNITPFTWGSLGQGILTGKYDKNITFESNDRRSRDIYVNFHGDKLLKNLKIVDVMREIAKNHNKPVSAVAIRFILDYLENSVVLFGAKNPNQVLSNVESTDWHLSSEEIKMLEEVSK